MARIVPAAPAPVSTAAPKPAAPTPVPAAPAQPTDGGLPGLLWWIVGIAVALAALVAVWALWRYWPRTA